MSEKNKHLKAQSKPQSGKKRDEKVGKRLARFTSEPELIFSFKYFGDQISPNGEGQHFKDWETEGLLADFFEKLVNLSRLTKTQAIGHKNKKNPLGIYENFDFETQSAFKKPSYPLPEGGQWATIKRIGGQEVRVAGFIVENIFYIVFLDKKHQFWKFDE